MKSEELLRGNGAELVRERALATKVQRALERLYQIEDSPDVDGFLERADEGEREALFLRCAEDGAIEMALRVPLLDRETQSGSDTDAALDPMCQIIEGVSHFVYIAERARTNREATQLELEVQAEVDKYVVLAAALGARLGVRASEALRQRLYEAVTFVEGTAIDRYRMANVTAARFVRRLERTYVVSGRYGEMHAELRRFFRMGQEEKLRFARAA